MRLFEPTQHGFFLGYKAIAVTPDGIVEGAADPRGESSPRGL
ncbi:hypothetical protein [Nostoc sp. CHAB 5836]|nr:hypothetical protein [Nostoc sp. CHAB 5836]